MRWPEKCAIALVVAGLSFFIWVAVIGAPGCEKECRERIGHAADKVVWEFDGSCSCYIRIDTPGGR